VGWAPKPPTPNPQSPIPIYLSKHLFNQIKKIILEYKLLYF